MRPHAVRRPDMKVLLLVVVAVLLVAAVLLVLKLRSGGPFVTAEPPPRRLVEELRRDVAALCAIGQRNVFVPESLSAAADLIDRELRAAGYAMERQRYEVAQDATTADNVIAELRGSTLASEIVIIGAHYDSVEESPGADDNASGVAAVLALARRMAKERPARTLRFVAFANEEPPHFQTEDMGSWRYAQRCHERGEKIVAMLSIESIGYYVDKPGSQQYPAPLAALYPSTGNFVAIVGNLRSRSLVTQCSRAFREAVVFPVEAAILPELISEAGWSDQWSFWQFDWPAVMVTDTAPFRNPHYHSAGDRPETLDYERLALVVEGLEGVVRGTMNAER